MVPLVIECSQPVLEGLPFSDPIKSRNAHALLQDLFILNVNCSKYFTISHSPQNTVS